MTNGHVTWGDVPIIQEKTIIFIFPSEIFLQPTLSSPACGTWHWVLLPDVRSSSSLPLDPGHYYHFQELNTGLPVESEFMWENEWMHNVTSACDNPYTLWWGLGVLFSSIPLYLVEIEQANGYSVNSPSDTGRNLFPSEKNQSIFTCSSLLKRLVARSFLLSFMVSDKNWPLFILAEE